MKIILTGATGHIGRELLTQCLAHKSITSVIALSRRDLGVTNPKLRIHLMQESDFLTYDDPALVEELKGASACLWAIGLRPSQAGSDERTRVVSLDYTQRAAEGFQRVFEASLSSLEGRKRKFRFVYISGAGVERNQNQSLWYMGDFRRLRGEAENILLRHAQANSGSFEAYIMRPGLVPSTQGTLKDLLWGLATSVRVDHLSRAMIDIAIGGHEKTTFENQDIIELGQR
ncbi:hypothetical protein BJY04DRAFT_192543 [Aspergillus karnatakaensis]|uniref:putative nucleoside-diphosphate-sugar epimerase n=1 Tax=Aspergillus karnatakaensis TaxID=1810916 RepID=UPI003CCCE10C